VKRWVLGLLAAVSIGERSASAESAPEALRLPTFDAQSCISEPEVRAALLKAGVVLASSSTEDAPGTTRLQVAGSPEHLSVELRGPEDRVGTTLLPPATCATATDVLVAFLVSTLAPVPALPPPTASPEPPSPAPLDAATLLAAVRAELAHRGIQLVIERVTLSVERDGSGTWFARVSRADPPSVMQTIALGNFDDPSPPRIDSVTDAIALAIGRMRALEPVRPASEDPLQRALARNDDSLSLTLLGAGELVVGTSVLLFLAGAHPPNPSLAFAGAQDAFLGASAGLAMLGGGASFFVSDDYRRAVIGVSSFAALGCFATAVTLDGEPSVPAYSTAAIAAGSYSTAALLGVNALLRRPPISRLRAAQRELRQRSATPEETLQIEADLAKTEPVLPAWLSYFPLMAGGVVSMMPAFSDGFSNELRNSDALVGAGLVAIGAVGAFLPSNYTRYQRELRRAAVSELSFGPAPGALYGISISGRF